MRRPEEMADATPLFFKLRVSISQQTGTFNRLSSN